MPNLDITLGNRSEASSQFNFVRAADGDVSFDDTEAHAVMTSAIEHRGKYWADSTHGSQIFEIENLTAQTPSRAEAMVFDSLQSLEQSGNIKNVSVVSTSAPNEIGGGNLREEITWTIPGSDQPQTLVVDV